MLFGMADVKKTIQAPPWLVRLMTPFIARVVAREMIQKYPGLCTDEILAKMRADMGPPPGKQAEQLLAAVAQRLPTRSLIDQAVDRPGATTRTDEPVRWYSPSSLALIAANLLPLYGVLVLGWPVFPIMLLFWLENVVIGVLNAARMLLADPADPALWTAKLFMVPFFCFHYGMFTMIHGVFVIALFGGNQYKQLDHGLWPTESIIRAVTDFDLALALIALTASHMFSFFWNYLLRGEFRRAALTKLMHQPYGRIIVLHVTIIFGGLLIQSLGSPLWALLLLIALKIGVDLKAHIREHCKNP